MKYLLAVDLGTTSTKTALYDEDLKLVASASLPYETQFPHDGWAEQDGNQWWYAFVNTVKAILQKSGINPGDIGGIGIDSMSSAVLPVSESGECLRPGLIWMDRRATQEQKWMEATLGDRLWEINGNRCDASNFGPKLLWIKNNEPEIYDQARWFFHANGYMAWKLTGVASTDISEGGMSHLFDLTNGEWSDELIDAMGFDRDRIPPIYQCSDVIGSVNADAAAETGLREGTPVVAGAMDNVAAGMGAGVHKAGEVYVSGGTVTNAGVCINQPNFNKSLINYHHIIPNHWLTVGGVDYGGAGLKWFKDTFTPDLPWAEVDRLADAAGVREQPSLFLPYMIGQRAPLNNNNTRGVLFGLNPDIKPGNIYRILMEGMAFGTRNVINIVEQSGIEINELFMTGGSANSRVWTQFMADIIGKPFQIPGSMDVAPLGSAIAAGVGTGVIPSFDAAVQKSQISRNHQPDTSKKDYYDRMYALYLKLFESIESCYDDLAAIRNDFPRD